MSLRSSGSMTLRRASRICSSVGIASILAERVPTQRNRRRPKAPPAEGGEILLTADGMLRSAVSPRPGLSGRRGGKLALRQGRVTWSWTLPIWLDVTPAVLTWRSTSRRTALT